MIKKKDFFFFCHNCCSLKELSEREYMEFRSAWIDVDICDSVHDVETVYDLC